MSNLTRKFRRSIAIHGISGVIKLVFVITIRHLLWFTKKHTQNRIIRQKSEYEFDNQYGVDTKGNFVPKVSKAYRQSWLFVSKYQGTNSSVLDTVLNKLPIHHENFTFIDLG